MTALTSDASHKLRGLQVIHTSDQQAKNLGVPVTYSGLIIGRITHRTQEGTNLQVYYIKDANEETYKESFRRHQNAELLYPLPGNQNALTPWHIDVFTNQEAHLSFGVQSFYWSVITWT